MNKLFKRSEMRFLLALTALAALVLVVIILSNTAAAEKTSRVYGTVTDSETEQPLEGADVSLYNQDTEENERTQSGSNGDYELWTNEGNINFVVTLDDYEEGTWTPGITTQTGTITVNASATKATYTKIGRAVFWTTRIDVTSTSAPSGWLRVTGLPFTSFNPAGDNNTCQAGQFIELASSSLGDGVIGLVPDNTTYCNLRRGGRTDSGQDVAGFIDSGTYFLLSGTYFVA